MKQVDFSQKMQLFRWISATFGSTVLAIGISSLSLTMVNLAACPSFASSVYVPRPLTPGQELNDTLSDRDIPTGQGGFARDYSVELAAGDQIAIDLVSEVFDPMVVLMAKDGTTIAENDDGPDGTPNSLLFVRIVKSGTYIVRVRSFGETAGGSFRLLLTQLVRK